MLNLVPYSEKKLAVKQEFKQESEFNICTKTGAGSGVNVFGAGVDSESKILDSDHLWFRLRELWFWREEQISEFPKTFCLGISFCIC